MDFIFIPSMEKEMIFHKCVQYEIIVYFELSLQNVVHSLMYLYFHITIIFLDKITGRRPRYLHNLHNITNSMGECYQNLKRSNMMLVRLNITWLNGFLHLVILFLSNDVRSLNFLHSKSDKSKIQSKNLPMVLKEMNRTNRLR